MKEEIEIDLLPGEHLDLSKVKSAICAKLHCQVDAMPPFHLVRQSIDARKWPVHFHLKYKLGPEKHEPPIRDTYQNTRHKEEVLIIGAGPAGYFAALELLSLGYRPIVLDRGKDVRARRRDLKAIQRDGIVNPDSNYCFGEGGAGTYSDGKLYTRSKKRGSIEKVLRVFVEHGAPDQILIDAHPHIGTNKLPAIVSAIRETIEHFGGEVHFHAKVSGLKIMNQSFKGVVLEDGRILDASTCILATGHSARDIYQMLWEKGVTIRQKPFALGVRVEHRQEVIDEIQYKMKQRGEFLPPSSYSLVTQVRQRGVFSFCMCPGGLVVPSATSPGEIVVNGMSPSRRDSPFANSGMVVAIEEEDLKNYQAFGPLGHMVFQREVEQAMFNAGDGSQKAPALRLQDFIAGRLSADLPDTSYIPGIFSAPLHELLPSFVSRRLQEGLKHFSKIMPLFGTNEAVVIGTESRTSAPVQIPRDPFTLMHPEVKGLFPCGEGAGYAGGIVSAAMDGIKVAQHIQKFKES